MFLWFLVAHACAVFGVFSAKAVMSIAEEKDRRTLDFLLATRLSNAEIVLGKLASCMTFLFAEFAVGLPIMLLLYPLGGIDPRLILLAYAGHDHDRVFHVRAGHLGLDRRGRRPSRRGRTPSSGGSAG